jgi:hypothetical protein
LSDGRPKSKDASKNYSPKFPLKSEIKTVSKNNKRLILANAKNRRENKNSIILSVKGHPETKVEK